MSELNKNAKHAIDQLVEAMHYARYKVQDQDDFNHIWEGYLTLVHALYTPEETYSVMVTPDIFEKQDGKP